MKAERVEGGNERRIVIGMITDGGVLGALAPLWRPPGPFPSRWANVVGGWCVQYHVRHGGAPGRAVEGLFAAWAARREARGDEHTVELVERFLATLSEEYEREDRPAPGWLVDQAGALFNRTALKRLVEELQGHLENGDDELAEQARLQFKRYEAGAGNEVDVLRDLEGLREAVEVEQQDPLVVYPGAAGRFFGHALVRDNFVVFQAPEKRGKSWWLIDLASRALAQRRRTLFFAAGDMTRRQMHGRFARRFAGRPLRPCKVQYPVRLAREGNDVVCDYEEREWTEPLGYDEARQAYREQVELHARSDRPYLRMVCTPSGHLTPGAVRRACQRWGDEEGAPPDVVVIDYADIMAPPEGGRYETDRDRINATWIDLRAMAAEFHCLLVTATQASADAYGKRTQTMREFSGDKRKNAHATGIVAINQTGDEKAQGLYRLNWTALREAENAPSQCLTVAGCLAICQPCLRSLL